MDGVRDQDVAWLRQESAVFGTLRYAIPGGFEAYGALDLPRDISPVEELLLDTLATDASGPLIAGWIDRGPWPPPPGDEHVLYSGWRYRLRRVAPSEVAGLPTEERAASLTSSSHPTAPGWSRFCGTTRGEASVQARSSRTN